MKSFVQKTLKTAKRYGMFSMGESVVAGVSGGPDSVVLAHVLKCWQRPLGLNIVVAHYDHRVRRESRADYRFVEKLSASLGFPFIGGTLGRGLLAKKGSLEDQLRTYRYA